MINSMSWLLILAILIFIEFLTLGLTTIWFAGGALVAFVVSLFFDNLVVEIVLFVIVSLVLLFFTRPLIIKIYNPKKVKTNYEGLVGTTGIVTMAINNVSAEGQVKVNGQIWSARSADDSVIEEGTKVVIHNIAGVKLIVSKKEEL